MASDSEIQLGNLQGEVELLRELVAVLFAQIPHTQAKVDAMHDAFVRAKGVHPDLSPAYVSVAHAWNQQVERMEAYPTIAP